MRGAGYRTVLVQPATARPPVRYDFLPFDRHYFAMDFEYAGPSFGWGKLPDQFVLDFVRRREAVAKAEGLPRFIEYMLITSHAPWSRQATIVDDWSSIGDGSVLGRLPAREHDTSWSNIDHATDAYLDAIVYDFEVLRRYLRDIVKDDSLVIILGDHQPPGGVTGTSSSRAVPIHVLSRRRALVEPFLARGYTPGLTPGLSRHPARMETFLFSFLRDFSDDLRQTRTHARSVEPETLAQ
jgi:hypothetical protein